MGDDPFGYIIAMVFGAVIACVLWVVLSQTPGLIVERGWMENKSKIYRVIPAEVVEKRGE